MSPSVNQLSVSHRRLSRRLAEQRRQMAEDRLMAIVRDGETTAVFYKGEQVGWRVQYSPRAAIALLAYLDRRGSDSVSHFEADSEAEIFEISEG